MGGAYPTKDDIIAQLKADRRELAEALVNHSRNHVKKLFGVSDDTLQKAQQWAKE